MNMSKKNRIPGPGRTFRNPDPLVNVPRLHLAMIHVDETAQILKNRFINLTQCHHLCIYIYKLGSVGILMDISSQAAIGEEVHNGQTMWIISRPQGLQLHQEPGAAAMDGMIIF